VYHEFSVNWCGTGYAECQEAERHMYMSMCVMCPISDIQGVVINLWSKMEHLEGTSGQGGLYVS
jgi:hypothetical protein